MAKAGLSSIIDKGFINSFVGLTKSKNSSADLAKALKGGSAADTSISDGLRLGARAFGNSVQNLNSLTNFVNISSSTLGEIGKITDRLIEITESATHSTTGGQTRRKMMQEFNDLGREFRRIVDKAKIGERELLNVADMKELFTSLGLEEDQSEGVAKLFEQFLLVGDGNTLVDETAKPKGQTRIPASVLKGPDKKITVSGLQEQQITTTGTPGSATLTDANTITLTGNSLQVGSATVNNVGAVMASSNASGFSLIQSAADYLGYNSGAHNQLFLVDLNGQVVQQVTNNSEAGSQYLSADLSESGDFIAYVKQAAAGQEVSLVEISAFGTDPATQSVTNYENLTDSTFSDVKISAAGTHLAYFDTNTLGEKRIAMRAVDSGERNNSLYGQVNLHQKFDFVDDNKIVSVKTNGASNDLVSYDYNSASNVIASHIGEVGQLATRESMYANNGQFYVAYEDLTAQTVSIVSSSHALVAQQELTGVSLAGLSIVASADNQSVELGMFASGGNLASTNQLYNVSMAGEQTITYQTRLSATSSNFEKVLDAATNLLRAPSAYKLLQNLKALKEQITTNLDALESARQLIADNIEMVRAAGFALLDLSDQVTTDAEAEAVARDLRLQIRKAPAAALAQAANLEPIAVAAMTLDENELKLEN